MSYNSLSEDGVSKMTTDSYLQNDDILRKITETIETLPVWQLV